MFLGDTVPFVLNIWIQNNDLFILNRNFVIIVCAFIFFLPLSLYKHISKLAKFSFIAMISLFYILLLIIIESSIHSNPGIIFFFNFIKHYIFIKGMLNLSFFNNNFFPVTIYIIF